MRQAQRASAVVVLLGLLAAGCATSKPKSVEVSTRVDSLEQQMAVLQQRVEEVFQRETAALNPAPEELQGRESSPRKTAAKTLTVRQVQRALASAGFYKGAIDGKQGPQTRQAIKEFQRSAGLKADGVVGAETSLALSKRLNE